MKLLGTVREMRSRPLLVVPFLCALMGYASAQDLKKTIEAQQKAFTDAIITKNFEAVEYFLAPDYQETSIDGTITSRAKALEALQRKASGLEMKSFRSTILRVTPKGKDVLVLLDAETTLGMRSDGVKKSHSTIRSHQRVEETWTKAKGHWQIRHIRLLKLPNAAGLPT